MAENVVYGEGGYDESKPNNNVVSVETVPDAPAPVVASDPAVLRAKINAAQTVPQIRGALLAALDYLDAVLPE